MNFILFVGYALSRIKDVKDKILSEKFSAFMQTFHRHWKKSVYLIFLSSFSTLCPNDGQRAFLLRNLPKPW